MSKCACDTPSKANYHVELIIDTPGMTTDVQAYYCAEHVPHDDDIAVGQSWYGREILESTTTHLRGEV